MNDPAPPVHDPTTLAAHTKRVLGRDSLLTLCVLLPPAAWSLGLGLAFAIVYPSARASSKAPLVAVSVGTGLLAASAAFVALALFRDARKRERDHAESVRTHALTVAACALSVFFVLAIIAQLVPVLSLELPR